MNKTRIYLFIFICITLISCSHDNNNNNQTSEPVIFETFLGITDSIGNEKSIFSQGEIIKFSINMRNLTNESQTMYFPSGQQYDIAIYDSANILIWNWAHDKAFLQTQTELLFTANETKIFQENWNQITNDTLPIAIGNYKVYANSAGPYYINIE